MTNALKTNAASENHRFSRQPRDRAIELVCMALALASAALLVRAISFW